MLSSAAGRVRGAGSGLQDIYPLSLVGLRIEGLVLFAVDMVTATTDSFSGTIRAAWGGATLTPEGTPARLVRELLHLLCEGCSRGSILDLAEKRG